MLKYVSERRYCIILLVDKSTCLKSQIQMGYILFMKTFVDERCISNNTPEFSILYMCPSPPPPPSLFVSGATPHGGIVDNHVREDRANRIVQNNLMFLVFKFVQIIRLFIYWRKRYNFPYILCSVYQCPVSNFQ